jgi:hypothetical protein
MMLNLEPGGAVGMGGLLDWLRSTGDPRQDALNTCKRNVPAPVLCTLLDLCDDAAYQMGVAECEQEYVCSGPAVPDKAACNKAAGENLVNLANYMAAEEERGSEYDPRDLAPNYTMWLLIGAAGLLVMTAVMRRR